MIDCSINISLQQRTNIYANPKIAKFMIIFNRYIDQYVCCCWNNTKPLCLHLESFKLPLSGNLLQISPATALPLETYNNPWKPHSPPQTLCWVTFIHYCLQSWLNCYTGWHQNVLYHTQQAVSAETAKFCRRKGQSSASRGITTQNLPVLCTSSWTHELNNVLATAQIIRRYTLSFLPTSLSLPPST